MIDPKTSFEKRHGKRCDIEFPEIWDKEFNVYLDGWVDGYDYLVELIELTKDYRALSDLQRGVT